MPDSDTSGAEPFSAENKPLRRDRPRHRPRKRSGRRKQNTYAALDLGTNNCRLLIARQTGDTFRVIDSFSSVVRLGAGLSSSGRLSDESMENAVRALQICAQKMKAKSVKRWRCVATQACRQAENGDEFMRRVKDETGISLEIISPRVEARLAVMGCLNLVDTEKDVALIVDIGGGSTELSWLDIRRLERERHSSKVHRPPIAAWASIPLGVVTLSEMEPETDDRDGWYERMKDRVRAAISDSGSETRFTNVFAEGRGHIIGTSGTITSLAGIHLDLPYYQRNKVDGSTMPSANAVRICRDMASRSVQGRASEPCIGFERARLLVAGCAITDVICEMWPSENIRVGDRGLREGLLLGLMNQKQKISAFKEPKPNNKSKGKSNGKTNGQANGEAGS